MFGEKRWLSGWKQVGAPVVLHANMSTPLRIQSDAVPLGLMGFSTPGQNPLFEGQGRFEMNEVGNPFHNHANSGGASWRVKPEEVLSSLEQLRVREDLRHQGAAVSSGAYAASGGFSSVTREPLGLQFFGNQLSAETITSSHGGSGLKPLSLQFFGNQLPPGLTVTRRCFCPNGVEAGFEVCRTCAKEAYAICGDDLSEAESERGNDDAERDGADRGGEEAICVVDDEIADNPPSPNSCGLLSTNGVWFLPGSEDPPDREEREAGLARVEMLAEQEEPSSSITASPSAASAVGNDETINLTPCASINLTPSA